MREIVSKYFVFLWHMAKWAITALLLILAASCTPAHRFSHDDERLLLRLDSVLEHHSVYTAEKEKRIAALRSLDHGLDAASRYTLYDRLYSEYFSYDFDSTATYAIRKLDAAIETKNREYIAIASLNLARAELARGNEVDALISIRKAEPDTLTQAVLRLYYDTMIAFEESQGHDALPYYQRLHSLLDSTSMSWVYNESNLLRALGRHDDAIALMEKNADRLSDSTHGTAISNFITGRLYLDINDSIAAMPHLIVSAINDVMTPVRDYSSLLELASLLFAYGDIDRAYRYINVTAEDLNASSVTANVIATNNLMPAIIAAYDSRNALRKSQQDRFIIGIAILVILLASALVWVQKSRKKAARAADDQAILNRRLNEINASLAAINAELTESNKVKDAYIVQYLNLCSYYIECVDRYRNNLRAVARNKGVNEMLYILNSGTTVDKELKEFYNSFDSTFLKLFPNFVQQFNNLLLPDKRVTLRQGELLTTELRVFALIRLGITDSEQIASFLRRSLSTIYNYRVKMRNAALGSRDDFERLVMLIASSDPTKT